MNLKTKIQEQRKIIEGANKEIQSLLKISRVAAKELAHLEAIKNAEEADAIINKQKQAPREVEFDRLLARGLSNHSRSK